MKVDATRLFFSGACAVPGIFWLATGRVAGGGFFDVAAALAGNLCKEFMAEDGARRASSDILF